MVLRVGFEQGLRGLNGRRARHLVSEGSPAQERALAPGRAHQEAVAAGLQGLFDVEVRGLGQRWRERG